jgi:hypothetical protein
MLGEVLELMTLQCWLYSADAQRLFMIYDGKLKKKGFSRPHLSSFIFLFFCFTPSQHSEVDGS